MAQAHITESGRVISLITDAESGTSETTNVSTPATPPSGKKTPTSCLGSKRKASTPKVSAKPTKLDVLENSVNVKFSSIESQLSKLSSCLEKLTSEKSEVRYDTASGSRETLNSPEFGNSPARSEDDVSLMLGQRERRGLLSEEDASDDSDSENYSEDTKSMLQSLFGDDAKTEKLKKTGMKMESCQSDLLNTSWHITTPERLSAFQEGTKETFPLNDETETFLNVPSLDPLVESLLIKKHGSKKSLFSKNGASLVSQPYKSIEKTAYLGQTAAKMGIASLIYIQKALGTLVSSLSERSPNLDKAVKTVKDVFAMSQKSLDQAARAGAFHHLVRRKATIADTGLLDYVEQSDLNLPLTSDGVFGKELEQLLQQRKDRTKKIEELIPELQADKNSGNKRKYSSETSQPQKKHFKGEASKPDRYQRDTFRDDRSKYQSTSRSDFKSRDSGHENFKKPAQFHTRGRGRGGYRK